jgi:hypothetical protein
LDETKKYQGAAETPVRDQESSFDKSKNWFLIHMTTQVDRIITEAIEIELHPNNMNKTQDFVSISHRNHLSAPSRKLHKATQVLPGH